VLENLIRDLLSAEVNPTKKRGVENAGVLSSIQIQANLDRVRINDCVQGIKQLKDMLSERARVDNAVSRSDLLTLQEEFEAQIELQNGEIQGFLQKTAEIEARFERAEKTMHQEKPFLSIVD